MASTAFEKQDRIIGQFNRTARQPEGPSFIEREMAKQRPAPAIRVAAPRISFYNPNNPLNGFGSKSKAEQLEIKMAMKKKR
jgi:hypothetical protein